MGEGWMWRRATLTGLDDAGPQQLLDIRGLKGETFTKVHRPQTFGLSATPPTGSEGLILPLGNRSDRALALGFEHPDHRPTDTPGGSTILYDASGNAISLVEKAIRIVAATSITLKAPNIVLEGEVDLGGKGGLAVDRTDNNPSSKVRAI